MACAFWHFLNMQKVHIHHWLSKLFAGNGMQSVKWTWKINSLNFMSRKRKQRKEGDTVKQSANLSCTFYTVWTIKKILLFRVSSSGLHKNQNLKVKLPSSAGKPAVYVQKMKKKWKAICNCLYLFCNYGCNAAIFCKCRKRKIANLLYLAIFASFTRVLI